MSPSSRPPRTSPPLDEIALKELGLRYVAKYQTTRFKLCHYLSRKLRERGWEGSGEPDLQALADRFAELGYINDAAFALSRSRSLAVRGYGKHRLAQHLRNAGVGEDDSRGAFDAAEDEALNAALRFARRRRIGPFAKQALDERSREKAIGSMVRAGHDSRLAHKIANLEPAEEFDLINICESLRADRA